MIRFKFIRDHRTEYSVKRMCHVLMVRRSSYCKWKNTQAARRQKVFDDAVLGVRIRTVFREEHGLYGAKRIAAALNDPDSGGACGGQSQTRRAHHEDYGHLGVHEETPRAHHRGRCWPWCLSRSCLQAVSCPGAESRARRRHYLPAGIRWRQYVSCHRDRLLFPQAGGIFYC